MLTSESNTRVESQGLVWFAPAAPLGGIGHVLMSTRGGGTSRAPYDSLNLGMHVGDVGERVRINRTRLHTALGNRVLEPVVAHQTHSATVHPVGAIYAGTSWQQQEDVLRDTDAMVTDARRLPLAILVADCAPVAIVDPVRRRLGAAHAGWRGLAGGILEATLGQMSRRWGTMPDECVAWVGACIGGCCYEVGPEVADFFPESVRTDRPRPHLDMVHAVTHRLRAAGLPEENISALGLCTSCHPDLFFSHRRTAREGGQTTGRMAMLAWLDG